MKGILPMIGVSSVVFVVGCCLCKPAEIVIRDPIVADAAEGGECPHNPGDIPLSGDIADVPEFHDCQRFIVKDDGVDVYDSLYAVFASFRLDQLTQDIDTLQNAVAFPQYQDSTVAVPGATIVSYGGTYDSLHIEPGYNCLYLWRRGTAWKAWMVNNAPGDRGCPKQLVIDPNNPPHPLEVVARAAPEHPYDPDYPAVARWEWDAGHAEHYIGIKCGAAWCEVSDDGTASAAPTLPLLEFEGTSTQERDRVRAVRGWHDAQRLAIWSGDKATPSNVWATVLPHPHLRNMKKGSDFSNWKHVATIVASDDYHGWVLRLDQGSDNKVFLCYGPATGSGCRDIPDGQLCESDRNTVRWWGKTEHGTGSTKRIEHHCIHNVEHTPPPDVPGTARWRWLARDETTWTRCDNGCCKVQ
jgi:hypothetical protein